MDITEICAYVLAVETAILGLLIFGIMSGIVGKWRDSKLNKKPVDIKPVQSRTELLPTMDQFQYGKNQLEFIDDAVNTLIEIKIANNVILGQSYSTLHIDTDIKELAEEAMSAFQAKFYDPAKSMYTREFLYKYLIEKCKIGLIQASRKDI